MRSIIRCIGIMSLAFPLAMVSTGCGKKEDAKVAGKKEDGKKEDGKKEDPKKKGHTDHPAEGPHGGALAEWGEEEYHAEFKVDHKEKKATVYILDGPAKKALPIAVESVSLTISNLKPPVQIMLKADPQAGDPKGSSSRFTGTHEKLGVEMEFKGEISGKIGDRPYSGTFEEKDDHDHKHEKKKS